jgi:hypothetical protein
MTLDGEIAQVASDLHSEQVVKRRAAVQQAAALLAAPRCTATCRDRIVELLRTVVATERYTTVRDDAQAVLANLWEGVAPTVSAADRLYMIGVRCKQGHVSYYDRRRVCSDKSEFMRETVRVGDRSVERFYVPCRTEGCTERRIALEIDCGEYGS